MLVWVGTLVLLSGTLDAVAPDAGVVALGVVAA
jgi:hypothetical protein